MTIKQQLLQEFGEKFTNCTEHASVERVIDGLHEHIPALRQDIESWLSTAIDRVEGHIKKSQRAFCEICQVFIDVDTGEREEPLPTFDKEA